MHDTCKALGEEGLELIIIGDYRGMGFQYRELRHSVVL
jgi:hypothetical protein